MKPTCGMRRLRGSASSDEPSGSSLEFGTACIIHSASDTSGDESANILLSTTDGVTSSCVDAATTVTAVTTCYCHCSSSRDSLVNSHPTLSSSSIPSHPFLPSSEFASTSIVRCGVCERLQGRCDSETSKEMRGRRDLSRESLARLVDQDSTITEETLNVKTLLEDRSEGAGRHCTSSKYASSVVRWVNEGPCETSDIPRACRRPSWPSTQWRRLAWILVFLMAVVAPQPAVSATTAVGPRREDGVCQSIDIRNNVTEFSRLRGCRVVEGFVQILLIDRTDEDSAYANLSFPELVEITGYLILYRVNGMRSVGRLFPNLTVIRGHSLFVNYALVAFEMMHLQEIGLHSLTDILRGSVRFEKNPALCYVNTIDWDIITKAGKGEHVISGNKPKNECPICDRKCNSKLTKPDETLCWNHQHCQKLCDRKCEDRACDVHGNCCHPSCLGDCTGPTEHDCKVCKDVMLDGNKCSQRCVNGTYEFMNRRCVTEDECRAMVKPREAFNVQKLHPYKPFNNSCVIECPAGYMDEEVNGKASCRKCEGPCLKKCPGINIDSIARAQKLRGCTHITGSLEIQIRGGKNIVKELEDNLHMIEEISGCLKVVRSFPLISLNFLKNLRVIRGDSLENGKYTLAVLDNQNLQELWDWSTHRDIQILSKDGPARIFFHFNPKLCIHKIETLREKAHLPEFTDLEVAPNSNGDKVACNVTEIDARVVRNSAVAALIEWEAFDHHDPRSLLGYVVYFIEAPNKNVTMYDGRDACGGDGWTVDDVSVIQSSSNSSQSSPGSKTQGFMTHILTQLKPYTQYAFYVKTYTIATERTGAQSKVKYFTTMPSAPSSPRALSTWSNSSSELVMSWVPPLDKNGNLTHYRIIGRWEPDDPDFTAQRNYCDEPMLLPEKKPISVLAEEERKRAEEEKELLSSTDKSGTCECNDREPVQSMREKEVSSSIAFEDALHNQVYVKRIQNSRTRRDVSEMLVAARKAELDYQDDQEKEHDVDRKEDGKYVMFERLVPSTNLTFVMRNLRHFAAYNIEVQACRERVGNESDYCSTKSMRTSRTLALESADNIPSNTFKLSITSENNSLTMVRIRWEEPPQPNGLILTYQIEYKRIDIQDIKATIVCITRGNFTKAGKSYLLKDLPAGNYSIKVRATSLAGNGRYTEVKYFYIKEYNTQGTFWILFGSIFCVVVACLSFGAFYVCKRKLMRNVPSMRLIATVNPEYVSTVYVPDEWEVPRKKIQLLRELGNGSFGMVYEGVAKDVVKGKPEVRCAVKTVNENATDRERIEFLNEASVMKAFNTHHVVRLLGVVSQGQPTLVVMELMVNGDLKTYLRSHRPDMCENFSRQPPTLKRILQMAIEIADGMAYLAAKKFVHRDLAARNCMVAEDLTVKVGDFGMTRDIYETDYYRKGTKGLLPVRWMAPESLKDGVFTSSSDVWSYGVVLWEMVTLASQPYQGLSNDQVLRYVIEGGVMERPENCPDSLYNLMRSTWNHKATRRPTFIDIAGLLLEHVNIETFERVSFYHSSEGIEARTQNTSHFPQNEKELELATLQDLREEEIEGEEDSPLRQDFGDFASFQPTSIKNSLSPRYKLESYGENSKATANFHDMNSSKIPLKDFDDIDGESTTSSKDALPFADENLKSVKSSPFINKKSSSRGNISQISAGKSGSSQSLTKRSYLDNSNSSKSRNSPDYQNHSPEMLVDKKEMIPLNVDFPSMNAIDIDVTSDGKDSKSTAEYVNKPETLNNGYIGGTTT